MERKVGSTMLVVATMAGAADAATLRMEWRGLGPDVREISLVPLETAIVDIYFQMNHPTETLVSMSFENHPALELTQVATIAGPEGWIDNGSINGPLGDGTQRAAWAAGDTASVLHGPGEYLIGSQTINLDDVGDGAPLEIMFGFVGSKWPELVQEDGESFAFGPVYAGLYAGYYGIGAGMPDIVCDPWGCPPADPLIVNPIPEPGALALLAFVAAALLRRQRRE